MAARVPLSPLLRPRPPPRCPLRVAFWAFWAADQRSSATPQATGCGGRGEELGGGAKRVGRVLWRRELRGHAAKVGPPHPRARGVEVVGCVDQHGAGGVSRRTRRCDDAGDLLRREAAARRATAEAGLLPPVALDAKVHSGPARTSARSRLLHVGRHQLGHCRAGTQRSVHRRQQSVVLVLHVDMLEAGRLDGEQRAVAWHPSHGEARPDAPNEVLRVEDLAKPQRPNVPTAQLARLEEAPARGQVGKRDCARFMIMLLSPPPSSSGLSTPHWSSVRVGSPSLLWNAVWASILPGLRVLRVALLSARQESGAWAAEGNSEQSGGQRRASSDNAAPLRKRWAACTPTGVKLPAHCCSTEKALARRVLGDGGRSSLPAACRVRSSPAAHVSMCLPE
eukprot:scaffold122434_cov63-Phaeocystis_antarctica.AAC.2